MSPYAKERSLTSVQPEWLLRVGKGSSPAGALSGEPRESEAVTVAV
ncbi:protein of unknown function (plasmid) [Caballeronia sp. S22]